MRTTVDIDERLLAEAMRLGAARTKKQIIDLSLAEFVRRRRLEALIGAGGTMDLNLTPEELDHMRESECNGPD